MHRVVLPLLLVACGPSESAWERTQALCGTEGWGADFDPTLATGDGPIDATYPSPACIDAVLDDLHVDAEAFELRDAERLPEGRDTFLEPIDGDQVGTGLAFPLYAARLLLMHDLGEVRDIDVDLLVQEGMRKRLKQVSRRRWGVQEAMYQWMVDDIALLAPASEELEARVQAEGADVRTSWNPQLDRLSVYEEGWPGGYASLGAIAHELRHDDGPDHVDVGGRSGDVTGGGAFGWEASAQTLVYRGVSDDVRAEHGDAMAAWVRNALVRIEQWGDGEGGLAVPWGGFPGG